MAIAQPTPAAREAASNPKCVYLAPPTSVCCACASLGFSDLGKRLSCFAEQDECTWCSFRCCCCCLKHTKNGAKEHRLSVVQRGPRFYPSLQQTVKPLRGNTNTVWTHPVVPKAELPGWCLPPVHGTRIVNINAQRSVLLQLWKKSSHATPEPFHDTKYAGQMSFAILFNGDKPEHVTNPARSSLRRVRL